MERTTSDLARWRFVTVSLLLVLTSEAGAAQGPPNTYADARRVELALASYLRDSIPAGIRKFEGRYRNPNSWIWVRTPTEADSIAARLDATLGTMKEPTDCPEGSPPTCSLDGAQVMVYMELPEVVGDTATLWVSIMQAGYNEYDDEYRAVKSNGQWVVTGRTGRTRRY